MTSWSSSRSLVSEAEVRKLRKTQANFNGLHDAENRHYLLIGVKRRGSNDPWRTAGLGAQL
jgi:hypothetical protein